MKRERFNSAKTIKVFLKRPVQSNTFNYVCVYLKAKILKNVRSKRFRPFLLAFALRATEYDTMVTSPMLIVKAVSLFLKTSVLYRSHLGGRPSCVKNNFFVSCLKKWNREFVLCLVEGGC